RRPTLHVIEQGEVLRRIPHLNRETTTVVGEIERPIDTRLERQELSLALPVDPRKRGHGYVAAGHVRQRGVRPGKLQVRVKRVHSHVRRNRGWIADGLTFCIESRGKHSSG